jgi:hypothetical protein
MVSARWRKNLPSKTLLTQLSWVCQKLQLQVVKHAHLIFGRHDVRAKMFQCGNNENASATKAVKA